MDAEEKGYGMDYINKRIKCPKRYQDATPEYLDDKLKQWANQATQKNLLLYGGVGTGKTYTSFALAKLFYVNKNSIEIYNIVELLNKIKSFFDKEFAEENTKAIITDNSILIIDDFGSEKVTDWSLEFIYRLINTRYEEVLQTIFISNLNPKELAKVYGDRIVSRIIEMSGESGIIKLEGKDKRLK